MTSNPSEAQLDHVTSRIIEMAQAVCPFAILEADTYFDHSLDPPMCEELLRRVHIYIEHADAADPNFEDHPSPRRLARYLLETVDYDILEAPLLPKLLADFSPDSHDRGSAWSVRSRWLLGLAVLAACLCVLALLLGGGSSSPALDAPTKHAPRSGPGKGWGGKRNGSRAPSVP